MMKVTNVAIVNPPGETPELAREEVWRGLLWKAEDATLFVPAIKECRVLEHFDDGLEREIVTEGDQQIRERVTFEPEVRVKFARLSGLASGHIINQLEEDDEGRLVLRFMFELQLDGASKEDEEAFVRDFSAAYRVGADVTLATIRRFAAENNERIVGAAA
jgi:hypothetical protein